MLNYSNVDAAKERIEAASFDENNQSLVNFSDICTEEETVVAAHEMGFEAEATDSDGDWWVYKED